MDVHSGRDMFPFRFGLFITLIGLLSALFPVYVPLPAASIAVVHLKPVAPHTMQCCNMPMGAHCNMPCCRARECCVCRLNAGKPLHLLAGPVSSRPVLPPVATILNVLRKITSSTFILPYNCQQLVSRSPKPGIPPPQKD